MSVFGKHRDESNVQWLLRLHLDPWFEDATPKELADFTGLPLKKVRGALYAWAKSRKVRRIHQHACAVAEQIGWPGTTEGLVHLALERYAQRFKGRDAVQSVPLDQEIKEFLASHRVMSDN